MMRIQKPSPVSPTVFTALALLLLPAAGQAAVQDSAPAVSPAVSRGTEPSLEARLERLCEEIERQRADLHVPGLALAVVKDDEVVLARGFGLADVAAGKPVTPETVFAIGSSTKAFTATLIGMLVEEGAMGWDDAVATYLPEFTPELRGAGEGDVLTIRDLLCHRSGFTRMSLLWAGNAVPRETVLRTAAGAEPWDDFRDGFHYWNVGYLAAGEASAAVAGTSWDELVAERLLRPLGMETSTTRVAAAQEDERLALGYVWREARSEHDHLPMRALDAIGPAGAINSNVLEMTRWIRFQLGRGEIEGRRLIGAKTLEETWQPQIELAPGIEYGLGWMIRDWNGRRVVEHGGNIDGFASSVALVPEEGLGFVLLANVTATPLQHASIGIVCEALLGGQEEGAAVAESADGSDDAESHEDYLGTYVGNFSQFQDADFEVLVQNGRLAVDVPGQMVFELDEPDEEGVRKFALPVGIAASFERDARGEVVELIIHQAGYTFGLPRRGVELDPEVPLEELEPHIGSYHDPALDAELTVLVQNNRLAVDVPGQMVYELRPPDEEGVWRFRISDELGLEFHAGDGERTAAFTFHERGTEREARREEKEVMEAQGAVGLDEVLALRQPDERRRILAERGPARIRAALRFANSGLEGELTLLVGGEEATRADVDFGQFGRVTTVVSPRGSWTEATFQPFRRLEGEELALARVEHPWSILGDWSRYFDSMRVVRTSEHKGEDGSRTVHLVRLESEGMPGLTYHVDAETGDVLKNESWLYADGIGTLPVTTTYEDFRDVGGVRTPFLSVSRNEAAGKTVVQVLEIEELDSLDEGAFDPPEGLAGEKPH